MGIIEITLGLLLAVAAVAALGKWVPVPLPILLVVGGIALSYLPGYDELTIEPETFFLLFIPPLLFADGWLIRSAICCDRCVPCCCSPSALSFSPPSSSAI